MVEQIIPNKLRGCVEMLCVFTPSTLLYAQETNNCQQRSIFCIDTWLPSETLVALLVRRPIVKKEGLLSYEVLYTLVHGHDNIGSEMYWH